MRAGPSVGLALLLLVGGEALASPPPPRVFAGIEPVAWLVRQVAGDEVEVQTLLPAGTAPETFEPSARHLVRLAGSDRLFVVGLPFERQLVDRLRGGDALPPTTDLSPADSDGVDPHVWLDPVFLQAAVETVTEELVRLRPRAEPVLRERAAAFVERLDALDQELRARLADHRGELLLTVHPAYGAFARRYGLRQVALEEGGHAPTARHLASLIEELRHSEVRLVLTQPQHSDRGARMLERELGLRRVEVDPLSDDVVGVLRRLADLMTRGREEHP